MNKPPPPFTGNCQEPFTPCWCESRPNNPHCKDVVSVPITNYPLSIIAVISILIVIYNRMKPKVKITVSEIEKLNAISKEVKKSLFERFYDSVGNFIGGGKSFSPKELMPL